MPGGVAVQRNVTVDLPGLSRQLAMLEIAPGEIDFRPALADVRVYLWSEAKKCFDESRAPDGTPWAPLKRQRNRRRDKRAKGGSGQKPLRDTGGLMASMTSAASGGISQIDRLSLTQGTAHEFAAVHNFGATINHPERRRGKGEKPWVFESGGETVFTKRIAAHVVVIPARPFVGLASRQVDFIGEIIADRLMRQYFGR